MTASTAPDLTVPTIGGRSHFVLRRLHSLTGLLFGAYLIVHLVVNATIIQAANVYQIQVNRIHELPFLYMVEWTFIFIPILFHIAYGIWITVTGQPNVNSYGYGKNWLYLLQRISAVIILLFMAFHVLALKYGLFGEGLRFEPHQALTSIADHMRQHPVIAYLVYPVGILASCFHLANGLWTAAISWGLTVSAGAQRRWGLICISLFVVTFLLGITALIGSLRVPLATIPVTGH